MPRLRCAMARNLEAFLRAWRPVGSPLAAGSWEKAGGRRGSEQEDKLFPQQLSPRTPCLPVAAQGASEERGLMEEPEGTHGSSSHEVEAYFVAPICEI